LAQPETVPFAVISAARSNRLGRLAGILAVVVATVLACPIYGNPPIAFPDIPGYRTLKCDFHIHTVFSDGTVWPNIRVEEALREGLDAIALTDHIEWTPHRSDVPFPDQNRAYAIAAAEARDRGLIVLNGAEITRDMPPGHLNALFLQDANLLKKGDVTEVLREAAKQGAFVIWNHPSWLRQTPDGVARVTPLHEQLLKENLFQGIEVVNQNEYSDEALQIALDRKLAIIGSSDIHAPMAFYYSLAEAEHRPVTLVFAQVKTEVSLKEALRQRRTVVWWKNSLIGRDEWLVPLLTASITAKSDGYVWENSTLSYEPKTTTLNVELQNSTDAGFVLHNISRYRLHNQTDVFILPAHGSIHLQINVREKLPSVTVPFEVMNAIVAPAVHPVVAFNIATGLK
jgi:hypothetical protein